MCGSALSRWTSSMRVTWESSATSTLILSFRISERARLGEPSQGLQQVALVEIALHEIGARADIDAAFAVLAGFERGHEDHRQLGEIAIGAHACGEIEAVETRH